MTAVGKHFPVAVFILAIMVEPATADQITAVPDAAWATVPTLQTWLNMDIAAQRQFATIPATTTINFNKGSVNAVTCSNFTVGLTNLPTDSNNLADNSFLVAGYEVRHLQPCATQIISPLIAEGLGQATTMMAYWLSNIQGVNVPAMSWAPMAYLKRSQQPGAIATQDEVSGPFDTFAAAGTMEITSRGDFRTFDKLMAAIPPTGTTADLRQKYLAAADQAFGTINGQPASQFIAGSPQAQPLPADGQYLKLEVYNINFAVTDPITGNTAFEAGEYPVVNSQGSIDWSIMDRENGVATVRTDGKLKYAVTDSTGKTVLSGYSDYSVTNGSAIFTTGLTADGDYPITGCWVAPGATDCDLTNAASTTRFRTHIPVLRNYPNHWKNVMWFLGNGLSLVNTGDATTTISLPGMFGVQLNGSRNDVLVSDGNQILRFTPTDPDNPVFTGVPSLFIPWPTATTPQIAAVVNAANLNISAPVSPGMIVTVVGSGLSASTLGATTIPLPNTMANVSATVNGIAAPLFLVSPGQVNVQVPYGVSGSTANVVVTTPVGTATSTVPMAHSFAEIFRGPAGEFFTDAFSWQWLKEAAGQWVTIWFTGGGAVIPPVKEGAAAPVIPPFPAVAGNVTVAMCGQAAPVWWVGLAPGWVGLYQADIWAPAQCASVSGSVPVITIQ
jgi:uncharacterized protein (TIGR03437 family)